MVRKLEKIEKEMGYCEIKLERERRLRKQALYLQSNIEALEGVLNGYPEAARTDVPRGRAIDDVDLSELSRRLRRRHTKTFYRKALRNFIAQATYAVLRDEHDLLERELEVTRERLESFSGFEGRREGLVEERQEALKGLGLADSSRIRKINEDFHKVENEWNSLTEDLMNMEETLFHLERNLDYMASARSFMISARNSFDIGDWIQTGYLSDLFRHSAVGRAKEMLEGADRNLKLAEKEFICLANTAVETSALSKAVVPYLRALFDDLFLHGKFSDTLEVIDACRNENEAVLQAFRGAKEQLESRQGEIEKSRDRMFSELGPEHRRMSCPETST